MIVTKHRKGSGENPDGGTDHRSDPNNQAEDERQIQKPVGDLIIAMATITQGEGRESRETGESVLPWTVTVENAGSRRRRDCGISAREPEESGRGTQGPWSDSAGETVGPWEISWRIRGTVEGIPWEQVSGRTRETGLELEDGRTQGDGCGRTQGKIK